MVEFAFQKELHGASGKMHLNVKASCHSGEFIALTGASGSGKTTLLRLMAGLEKADAASFKVNGEEWSNLSVQERSIGFLFQDYALFPNMNVLENLLFAANDQKLAMQLLDMVQLSELKKRKVTMLSGGQKQRVALARAMMRKPKLLLLDEPLSALDAAMRSKLQRDMLTMHEAFGMTTVLVSHDPSEIYTLAKRVFVLEHGKIKNEGTPKEVLLKMQGSQKFSFSGKVLEVMKVDVLYVAVVAIDAQLVEVVLGSNEAENIKAGDSVIISTKAFTPVVKKMVQ